MPRLFVKSDKKGQILAVAKVDSLPEGRNTPFEDDPKTVEIVEITDPTEKARLIRMEVGEIHTGYVMDMKKKVLKKKSAE